MTSTGNDEESTTLLPPSSASDPPYDEDDPGVPLEVPPVGGRATSQGLRRGWQPMRGSAGAAVSCVMRSLDSSVGMLRFLLPVMGAFFGEKHAGNPQHPTGTCQRRPARSKGNAAGWEDWRQEEMVVHKPHASAEHRIASMHDFNGSSPLWTASRRISSSHCRSRGSGDFAGR